MVLSERATKQELKEIAESLHETGFKNTFIGYRISGENQGSYWATTHFTPTLDVKIIGSTVEQHQALNDQKNQSSSDEIVGSWRANWGFEYRVLFKGKDDNLTVESLFSDGSRNEEALLVEITPNQKRYYTEAGKDHKEFFIINDDGNLEFWSENGHFYTAPKEN